MSTGKTNPPKLLLDEQIWVYLAKLLRDQGYEVHHVTEVGLEQTPDPLILERATENHQAVVTFNIKDFIPIAIEYFEDGKEHYGIVVSDQIPQGELQKRVTNLLQQISAEELKSTVRYLQEFK